MLLLSYPNVPPPRGDGVTWFERQQDLEGVIAGAGFSRWEFLSCACGHGHAASTPCCMSGPSICIVAVTVRPRPGALRYTSKRGLFNMGSSYSGIVHISIAIGLFLAC